MAFKRVRRRRAVRRRKGGRGIKSTMPLRYMYRRPRASTGMPRLGVVGRKRTAQQLVRRNGLKRRRKFVGDPGGHTQWRQFRFSKRFGRLTQKKLNKLSMERIILSWRQLRSLTLQGQLYMNHCLVGTDGIQLPVYLVELNSCINTSNAGVLVNYHPVFLAARYGNSNATLPYYNWGKQGGQTPTGAISNEWQKERMNVAAFGSRSIFRWADIRLDLWGTRTQPTKYDLCLCQFHEDVCPVDGNNSDPNYVRFWDGLMRPFTYNPNISQPGYGETGKMRVLARKTVMIDPTESTEGDPDPHVKSVKMFYRFDRQCRWDWKDDVKTTGYFDQDIITRDEFNTSDVPYVLDDFKSQVHPNARIFLMIRATKYVRSDSYALQTTADTPSINMQVRVCHVKDNV